MILSRPDRIGIFGGFFNPVHRGHLALVSSVLESRVVDRVWVIPTYEAPHKPTEGKGWGFADRFNMAKIAFQDFDNVDVLDVESNLTPPSYTLHTLQHLRSTHPLDRFFLCIGEDSLQTFHTWHKPNDILKMATLLVAARPGWDFTNVDESILSRTILLDHEPVDISSTQLRSLIESGSWEDPHLISSVPDKVLNHIHHLKR